MAEVRMPRLSESMAEGTIVRWLLDAGGAVERGDELAEIETDKATVTFEADAGGVLEILAEEGATLPVGALIARVAVPGEVSGGNGARGPVPAVSPPGPAAAAAGSPAPPPSTPPDSAVGRVPASPLARRRARELGVDLAGVVGSGPGGRIVRADVEAAVPPERGVDARGPVTEAPLGRARQLTVARMSESARTVPSFPLTTEIDMSRVAELRERIGEVAGARVPTVTDIVVAACGRALREHPRVNAAFVDGAVSMFGRVNVGVAVDTGEALLVPVVADADRRSLSAVAAASAELAARARAGTIGPAELEGATFTVSNLGMFGVTVFEAVINPPQAAILAVGAVRELPRVVDGAVVVVPVMAVTLTSDHRVLDGAEAARFLRRVAELVERPMALMVEGGGGSR